MLGRDVDSKFSFLNFVLGRGQGVALKSQHAINTDVAGKPSTMTRLTTITIFLLTSITLFGQDTIEIAGEVISKHGTPLPGTNIVLHKTTNGTVTNACGQFKLRIPKDKKGYLSFSMISLPFYFDLVKIKDEDLEKGIVFKIIPFNEDKGILNKNKWKENITIECEKFEDKVVFKITEKNREWPVDKN